MYSFEVAHSMNFLAESACFDDFGIASAQAHSQCEPFGVTVMGAARKPSLSAICDCCLLYSMPAATVASIHIAHLPEDISVRFSLKPFELAPGGPSFFSRST